METARSNSRADGIDLRPGGEKVEIAHEGQSVSGRVGGGASAKRALASEVVSGDAAQSGPPNGIPAENEDHFRDLVEHSIDLICTHDLNGRLLSVNELPAKILGYSKEEMLHKPMRDFLLPEARAEFDEALVRLRKTGSVKGVMVVVTKSGERRIWEYYNTLKSDGVHEPIVRGMAHDITDQKRMERALRRSEEKFSKAFLSSPYAMVISGLEDGKLIEVNESFLRIMGFAREEALGKTALELGIWMRPEEREEILEQLIAKGRVRGRDIAVRTKSGERLDVNYCGEVIELGGKKCLLSVCEDVTARRRADEKLREYEKAIEGVEEMISVVGKDYRFLLANRAFVTFRGRTKEEVVGRLVSEVVGEGFFEQVVRAKLQEALNGSVVKYETRYKYPVIGERDILVTYLPMKDGEGEARVVCVLRDITERKRTEEELRRLSGELLRLQDEERRKIARDLHDSTGQDLVALATTLSQLHASMPSENRKWRRQIAECEALALRALREVRTLSYLLHPPMLDEAGLEDAVRYFAGGFEARTGIQVAFEVEGEFRRLPRAIELGLFRVVQESLVNIQRHSGSFVARIRLSESGRKIVLEVSDRGRGIEASQARKDGTNGHGFGVGIPSMEERVKHLGGILEIDSSEWGTTVRVSVPTNEEWSQETQAADC